VRHFLRRDNGPTQLAARHLLPLLLIGYFEGIDSERRIAWRAADSLALRDFLGVGGRSASPCRTRDRGDTIAIQQTAA
jgi:transposase